MVRCKEEPVMIVRRILPTLALIVPLIFSARADADATVPKFYAYCVEFGEGLKPRPMPKMLKLLREVGFDGIALHLCETVTQVNPELESNLKLLDDAGLKLYMALTPVNVNPANGAAYSPQLPEVIRKLKGRPVTVCVALLGLKPGDPQGMAPAVKTLRELGDAAAEAGVRISIYGHVGNWTESLPFIIEVVRKANHPQVGFNFNLCHWLKVDGAKDYRPLLRDNADKLFAVMINGATVGAQTWTAGLIRPLDEGDFDNRELLALLRKIGYCGPVGLMCYGIPGDAPNTSGVQ